jgi:Right handed beta helix region
MDAGAQGEATHKTRASSVPLRTLGAVALCASLALPAAALAHVERPSYWPDPAADTGVTPAAGGEVPVARSLDTALTGPDETRVVCKKNSLDLVKAAVKKARDKGYRILPSDDRKKLGKNKAKAHKALNGDLFDACEYKHIQAAVNDSGNNDRVVVMPGDYIEQPSREALTNDPACDAFELPDGSVSYEYQAECPNDQSLIFVQGREVGASDPPDPPLEDRHGIPDEGDCVRCNLQIEGSGLTPNEVLVDAATDPKDTELKELGVPFKDVGMRVDRADGFVLRNMTFAHALEHGVYVMETDGFLLEKTKYFYNGEYGSLMFQTDHGLMDTCEGMGHGDSAIYPGAAADTGEDAADDEPEFYPDAPRTSNTMTNCDIHHNTLGYSGTMGNATRVTGSRFWDNGTAITTDSLYAGGHPGFPQDSARFDNNKIYSNNFNSFEDGSDVVPRVPVPVGVGIFIAGGNNNEIDNNRIYDNWKRGTMLLTLPDPLFDRETELNTTSHRNRYHDNVMGVRGNGTPDPNGVDFWWDSAAPLELQGMTIMETGVEDNCWFDNGDYSSDPPPPDVPGTAQDGRLPEDCENTTDSPGFQALYNLKAFTELLPCEGAIGGGVFDPDVCHWFQTPPEPGKRKSAAALEPDTALRPLGVDCRLAGDTETCAGFTGRP